MNTNKNTQTLIEYLLAVQTPQDMEAALKALLTPAELSEITNRLQIIKLLEAGESQRRIAEKLGVGIATVSRGARALKDLQE